jgi:hypothetical protein
MQLVRVGRQVVGQVKRQVKNAALVAMAALAVFGSTAHAQEIYVHGGTLGAGIGAALPLNSWAGVHAEFEGFNRGVHSGCSHLEALQSPVPQLPAPLCLSAMVSVLPLFAVIICP